MRISGMQVADAAGNIIENPTPFQVREALCQLLEATGSQLIRMTVDGLLLVIVMAGDDEVPDSKADRYTQHLVELAENFVEIAKSGRAEYLARAKGGVG